MILFLTGPNAFALQHELHKRVRLFVEEYGDLALERIDGEECDFERIREAVTSLPFLASKKMVVLRAPGAIKEFTEKAEELLEDIPETTDVIIVEPKLDKRLSYYKFLKKKHDVQEFADADENGLAAWLQREAKEQGGSISSKDARFLVQRVGMNQQLLYNELAKLITHDPSIVKETIKLLTDQTPQSTVFQLLEAAFAGNLRRAEELYQEQRALKVEPQQIVAMLGWQLHVLALLKTAGERSFDNVAKASKQSPYTLRRSQGIANKMTLTKLKTLVDELTILDLRSKREAIDLDDALQRFLILIAQ